MYQEGLDENNKLRADYETKLALFEEKYDAERKEIEVLKEKYEIVFK